MSNQATPANPAECPAAARATIDELQLRIARLEHDLIAQQRLATLGTMSAMVAHEFYNLMTPVVARGQDALARGELPAMRRALQQAVDQARKAVEITRHLLELASDSEQQPRVCLVADALRAAVESAIRPFEKDGIDLRLRVPRELAVRAAPRLLEQVLLNLLLNARQAMQQRGGVLSIGARRDGSHVLIDLRDSGRGIAPERLAQVINPFLAADPGARPGDWRAVGMGLNVCRTIARRCGATLQASANPDAGCTFHLRWPAA